MSAAAVFVLSLCVAGMLAGCASAPYRPVPVPTTIATPFIPAAPLPPATPLPSETVHTLILALPEGRGAIELTKSMQDGRSSYRSRGVITATDALGEWQFAYTATSLNDTLANSDRWIFGIQGLAIALKNTTADVIEVDWTRSAFVDATGRASPVIHRGVRLNDRSGLVAPSIIPAGATLDNFVFPADGISFDSAGRASSWVAPAVIERLTPGASISVTFNVKTADKVVSRTFKFSVK